MTTSSNRAKTARTVAALAAAASLGSLIVTTSAPVAADPRPVFIGVGSDTTQDVMNALGGVGLTNPTALVAGGKSIASWDATAAGTTGTCITPKPSAATFDRPNGSTNGRKALSRAIDSTPFTVTGSGCPAPGGSSLNGVIDFARSSAGPAAGGGPLMYLPFGRDALSFAYAATTGTTPVTTLTSAQLTSIFQTGPTTIGGVNVVPCSIQVGSGTYNTWNTDLGVTPTQMAAATTTCGAVLQENDGNALRTRANTFGANTQLIIGFSAANFISQSNGVAVSQLTMGGVDLGAIDALGKPYTGTAPALAASGTFYGNTTYGRSVYNVVQASKITGLFNTDLKQMFAQTAATGTPAICGPAAQATVNAFGFLSLGIGAGAGNCGDTSLTGPSISGNGSI